jgi:hypothetical protein
MSPNDDMRLRTSKDIGALIRQRRHELDLSQLELAEHVGSAGSGSSTPSAASPARSSGSCFGRSTCSTSACTSTRVHRPKRGHPPDRPAPTSTRSCAPPESHAHDRRARDPSRRHLGRPPGPGSLDAAQTRSSGSRRRMSPNAFATSVAMRPPGAASPTADSSVSAVRSRRQRCCSMGDDGACRRAGARPPTYSSQACPAWTVMPRTNTSA